MLLLRLAPHRERNRAEQEGYFEVAMVWFFGRDRCCDCQRDTRTRSYTCKILYLGSSFCPFYDVFDVPKSVDELGRIEVRKA